MQRPFAQDAPSSHYNEDLLLKGVAFVNSLRGLRRFDQIVNRQSQIYWPVFESGQGHDTAVLY